MLHNDTGTVLGSSDREGVFQVVWESDDTLIVLSERAGGRVYEATRCDRSLSDCATAWRGTAVPSEVAIHPVWLIEEQR